MTRHHPLQASNPSIKPSAHLPLIEATLQSLQCSRWRWFPTCLHSVARAATRAAYTLALLWAFSALRRIE